MAKEEIALSVSVDTGNGAKSLKSLKDEFKNAQKELDGLTVGTKEYVQQLAKLGGIRDEIGDLNQEINAFNPEGKVKAFGNVMGGLASGFQAAQGAAALFGGESKSLEKTLLKVQAATAFAEGIKGIMAMGDAFKVLKMILISNPIMLIATVLLAVGIALYNLKDKVKIIGLYFELVGKVIGAVVQAFKDLTDWMGLTSNASDDLAEKQIANAKKMRDAVTEQYDRQIDRASAAGKNTLELERKKQEAIIKTLRIEAEAIIAAAKARGNFTEEENKRITELIAQTQKASDAIVIINIKENKQKEDDNAKATEKYKQELEKRKQATLNSEKALQDLINSENKSIEDLNAQTAQEKLDLEYSRKLDQFQKLYDAAKKAGVDDIELERLKNQSLSAIGDEYALKQAEIDAAVAAKKQADADAAAEKSKEYHQKDVEANQKAAEQKAKDQIEADDRAKKHREETLQQGLALTDASLNAAKGLSDLYFAGQARKAKGNAAAELALKKKQFKVDKAFNIVRATIDGIRSVQAALTQSPPLSYALAAVNAVMAGANIAKIASAKFEGGESGGGGSAPSLGSAGGGVPITPPSNGSTLLNPDGSIKGVDKTAPTVKAVVVETDITKTQKRVGSIETKAKL